MEENSLSAARPDSFSLSVARHILLIVGGSPRLLLPIDVFSKQMIGAEARLVSRNKVANKVSTQFVWLQFCSVWRFAPYRDD